MKQQSEDFYSSKLKRYYSQHTLCVSETMMVIGETINCKRVSLYVLCISNVTASMYANGETISVEVC